MRRRIFWPDRCERDPEPKRDTTRQKCFCGCPDALVLFLLPRCHNVVCPHFDGRLEFSGDAGELEFREWFWAKNQPP